MKKTWMFAFVLFLITACSPAGGPIMIPTPVASQTPRVESEQKSLPTPIVRGQVIVDNTLQVTMSESEITTSYLTEYGTTREPPAGKKIIWTHVLLKDMGQAEWDLPAPEHFSIISKTTEFKPTYGHRQDHVDYMSLNTTVTPDQKVDAWLRFDIPAEAELQGLWFVFMPESSAVSFGFSSSDFSWGDHPIYLWTCVP